MNFNLIPMVGTCPWEKGWDKELNSQHITLSEKHKKGSKRLIAGAGWQDTSQSRAGSGSQSWSGPEGIIQNWTAPTCWGRRWLNNHSWRITQLLAGDSNSSDHPARTERLTLPHTFNWTGGQKIQTLLSSNLPGETTSPSACMPIPGRDGC
jgi:hypothetical protein